MQRDAFALEVAQRFQAAARAIQVDFNGGRLGFGGPGGDERGSVGGRIERASAGRAHRVADGWDHDSSGEG